MRRNVLLVGICLLTATAMGLLAMSRTDHQVSLESVVELWGDIIRDVDRVGLTITRVSDEREIEINAFALPGGGIVITTGMLNFLESEAELAATLGHEISHVDLRHCIERLQYELAARKIVGRELAMIARIQYQLVNLGFNEQQELEADAGGVILAAKAGYDPRAAITVFERLAKVKRERQVKKPREKPTLMVGELGIALEKALEHYFATHPPTDKRVRQLESVINRNASAWRGQQFYVGRSNYRDASHGRPTTEPMSTRLMCDEVDSATWRTMHEGSDE